VIGVARLAGPAGFLTAGIVDPAALQHFRCADYRAWQNDLFQVLRIIARPGRD
jgi:hypothetical protein